MKTYFISDLHLAPSRQDITDCFLTFIKNEAVEADAFYVLGDFFEFWISDDYKSDFATSIRQAFIDLVKTGVQLLDEVSTISMDKKRS